MTELTEAELDRLLNDYLRATLDGRCGRAERFFRDRVSADGAGRRRLRTWLIAGFSAGLAASVAAICAAPALHLRARHPTPFVSGSLSTGVSSVRPRPQIVQRYAESQVLDEGVILLDGKIPVRVLHRTEYEKTRWLDDRHVVQAERVVPRDDLAFVQLTTY